jgi:hypothetical protein
MEPRPAAAWIGLHQIFPARAGTAGLHLHSPLTGGQHERHQPFRSALRAHTRRRDVPRGLSRRMQAQPCGVRHRRRAHAQGDRRAAADRHAQRHAAVAPVREQGHQDLSRLRRVLRHGRCDRAGRLVLPPCRAGARGEETDPLPARPRGRRQELDRRAPEAADAGRALLRHQGLAGERVATRPVRSGRGRRVAREGTACCRPGP